MIIAEHLAARQNRLKHTILKEVLHADILRALHESDLGKSLVFQGGTALRLCYGNQRYSEDLDFVRSAPLEPTHFEHFKKTLKTSIAERYELDVRISDPKRSLNQRTTDTSIAVHRFTAIIAIEKPGFKNQKIHIEVADIPAYDARPRMINNPYAEYGAGPVMPKFTAPFLSPPNMQTGQRASRSSKRGANAWQGQKARNRKKRSPNPGMDDKFYIAIGLAAGTAGNLNRPPQVSRRRPFGGAL